MVDYGHQSSLGTRGLPDTIRTGHNMTHQMLLGRDLQPDTHSLWRYQPLPRLEDLLQRRAQFFPSLGTLSKTMDPLEGQLTELNFTHPELEVNRVWVEQLA